MDKSRLLLLLVTFLFIIFPSGCNATQTAVPTTPSVAPITITNTPQILATVTPTFTATNTPTITPSPTPEGLLASASDNVGDGMHAPGEETCLPDYMDFLGATFLKTEEGGLKIIIEVAESIPEDFEGNNNGFYFPIFFNEITDTMQQANAYIDILSKRQLYASPDTSLEINENIIIINIGPQTITNWPDNIYFRLESSYMPPGSTIGCPDSFPDKLTEAILVSLRK